MRKQKNVRIFLNSLYETIVTLVTKFYKNFTRKKYKPMFILNIEVKILSELLKINFHDIKEQYCVLTRWIWFQGRMATFTSEHQAMHFVTLTFLRTNHFSRCKKKHMTKIKEKHIKTTLLSKIEIVSVILNLRKRICKMKNKQK